MPPDQGRADAPARWLNNARADLALAQIPLPAGALYELLCFHAQQAAEKAIKAVLCAQRIEFPFTHNLQLLIDLLPADMPHSRIADAVELTPYAVSTRYPGELEPVTAEEHAEAVRIANNVIQWAESFIFPNIAK